MRFRSWVVGFAFGIFASVVYLPASAQDAVVTVPDNTVAPDTHPLLQADPVDAPVGVNVIEEPAPIQTEVPVTDPEVAPVPADGVDELPLATPEAVTASASAGGAGSVQQVNDAPTPLPDRVGSGGDFSYHVDFDLPEFRGLVPNIGLVYNSNNRGQGGVDNIVANGWRLTGFSSIERRSLGGGVPFYDDGQDIYALDGAELMACREGTTDTWVPKNGTARYYPLRYLTDTPSGSCTAGGSFVTRIDDHRRIVYNSSTNAFEVTTPDGTRYIYRAVIYFISAGSTPAAGTDGYQVARNRKWLLQQVVDTFGNKVEFDYAIGTVTDGFAERPLSVEYVGYKARFYYTLQPSTGLLPQFGTGTSILGTQRYALSSIAITNGANQIRAYSLETDPSALSGTRLLSRVRSFGADYALTGANVTSGSQLPVQDFRYSDDVYTTTLREYSGVEFHRNYTIADWDYTGIDNLIMLGGSFAITGRSGGSQGEDRLQFGRALPLSRTTFDRQSFTIRPKPNAAVPCFASYSPWTRFMSSEATSAACIHSPKLNVLSNERATSPQVATTTNSSYWESSSGNSNIRYTISTVDVTNINTFQIGSSVTPDNETQSADLNMAPRGNFDLDINTEIVGMEPSNDAVTEFTDGIMSGEAWQGSSRPLADTFAAIGDFDGNSVDDIFTTATSWISYAPPYEFVRTLPELGYFGNAKVKRGPGPSLTLARSTAVPMLGSTTLDYAATSFADMNGDGLTDIAGYYRDDGKADQIHVQFSTGFGFAPIEAIPVQNLSGAPLNFLNNDFPNEIKFRDLNGDSIPEVIVNFIGPDLLSGDVGCRTAQLSPFSLSSANCVGANAIRGAQALVLFRQGNAYRPIATLPSAASFSDFVDVGDFDGNGVLDMFLQSTTSGTTPGDGKIMFGTSAVPNMLVRATNTLGGVTEVEYRTSPYNADGSGPYGPNGAIRRNQIPGAQIVVDRVVERDGRAGTAAITTSYDYADGRYDFFNRKNLGFGTIAAYRQAVNGGDAPIVVSTYLNNTIAEYGLLASRVTKTAGGTILQRAINTWDVDTVAVGDTDTSGNGPYQVAKLQERVAVRYDTALIETTKAFTYSPFGAVVRIRDFGRTTGDPLSDPANDLIRSSDPFSDNTMTFFYYMENTDADAYIVNQPYAKRIQRGHATSADNSLLLAGEYYRYPTIGAVVGGVVPCAAASAVAPARSAICAVYEWNGGTGNSGFLSMRAEMDRDARGNVVAQRDAKGNETRFTYDPGKNLFQTRTQITTSVSVNHNNLTAWSGECQQPNQTTDPNGQMTTFTYDVHCREIEHMASNLHRQFTVYRSFGDADAQNVRRSSEAASSYLSYSWEYMDGFGRVWKTARSNGTNGTAGDGTGNPGADALYEMRRYDVRGNLGWASLPLSGTEITAIGASERTLFSYDPLDRQISATAADGAITTNDYGTWSFAHFGRPSIAYPSVTHTDALCNDGIIATSCRPFEEAMDSSGLKIRERRFDNLVPDGTDGLSAGFSPDRITQFGYDQLGQLTDVIDPAGATWSYTYDAYGNRTVADDPGLGRWTMEYDLVGNLIRQVDAKGQPITFAYDQLNRVTLKTVGAATSTSRIETRFTYDQARANFFNIGHETRQQVWSATSGVGFLHEVERDYNNLGLIQQERHIIDGRTFPIAYNYTSSGHVLDLNLPFQPGTQAVITSASLRYDTANRVTRVIGPVGTGSSLITNIDYSARWGLPTATTYGSGVVENASYDSARGWMNNVYALYPASTTWIYRATYTRDLNGRVTGMDTGELMSPDGSFTYKYDYAGRLLSSRNIYLNTVVNQNFSYDRAGRLRTKGRPTFENTYTYPVSASRPFHAPGGLTPTTGTATTFDYDANGNMTASTGANPRAMGYDGENRPLWVARAGKITCYAYGVDGSRVRKIEGVNDTGPATNRGKPCADLMPAAAVLPAGAVETVTFNQVEVRKWGTGAAEVITTYPHPNIRLIWTRVGAATSVEAQALHRDQLGSVRAVTTFKALTGEPVGNRRVEAAIYKPFGEQTETLRPTQVNQEQKGWIGQRYDADAGLQYLNARYYDPEYGFFLQPDWFEVTAAGVGTNRYSYSFNDPINKMDPGGNDVGDFLSAVGDFFGGMFGGGGSQSSDDTTTETRMPPPNSNVITGRAFATPGHPSDFDPWGGGAGWELMYGPQAIGTMSPTTVDQLGIIAAAGTVMSSLPSAAEAAVTGAVASAGTRTFYRAVTSAEAKQIAETGVLMPGRNSLEGKWMAEKLKDAIEWGTRMNGAGASTIAEISVPLSRYDSIVNAGQYYARLDGIGPALYVPFENLGGLVARMMTK